MDQNLISSLAWVSRGYARHSPLEYEMEEEEINNLKQDNLIRKNINKDLGQIDEQDDEESGSAVPNFCEEVEMMRERDDENYPFGFEDMSEEEKEDYHIKDDDALIVIGKVQNEYSTLEILVYEHDKQNLYVHHEIPLSAFPLSLEWLKINPSSVQAGEAEKGNFVIVGSFLNEIEIWNLDVINQVEPHLVLGGEKNGKKVKKFKKQKSSSYNSGHEASVIALHLNTQRPNILCSGSADTTVKLWDIQTQQVLHTYTHHSNKVQVVKWNPQEQTALLTASFDNSIKLFDCRTPQEIYSHTFSGDIESATWDSFDHTKIIYSTEQGFLNVIDARNTSTLLFSQKISTKAVTSVNCTSAVNGLIMTTSLDGNLRVFKQEANGLRLVQQKSAEMDGIQCGSFYQDEPFVFGSGCGNGELYIWDIRESKHIQEAFGVK